MREVVRLLPHENIVYLGDTAHLPYGNKSPQTILRYALENTQFLVEKNCKLLIIACHTACSHALREVQEIVSIPVLGMIQPGFELLRKTTRTNKVAVLATASTISSGIYQSLIREHLPNMELHAVACPLFVPLIEEGFFDTPAANWIAQEYLKDLKDKIDVALLGCTHYPLIRSTLQKILGPRVQLIEPAAESARQALDTLKSLNLLNPSLEKPTYEFFSTDDPEKFKHLGKIFFGSSIEQVLQKTIEKK